MILADAAPATAPANQQGPQGWTSFIPLLLMVVMLYFIFIRPQTKKAREQAALMKSIKPGDKVVTSSGIVGIVVSVKDKTAAIRSAETKLEVLKSAITDITERAGDSSNSES
jgi:preprotein translocase subunit YajC